MKYRINIRKVRATWHWFRINPQGGGFGSNAVCSKKSIIQAATQALPPGTEYDLYNDDKYQGRYRKP